MADLRARLKEIETAAPPDLWAGIVARAEKEGPEMDGTNVVAFRKDGSEWRRRAATALVAAAVFVVGFVVVWRAFQPAPTVIPPGGQLPADWIRCTNDVVGYSIGYPGDWFTTDVLHGTPDPANACRWFSPDPFGPDGNVVSEGWGYPLEVAVRDAALDDELGRLLDPEVAETVEQEELTIDGNRAVRLEYETLVDVIAEPGLHYSYLVELDPETTIVVHTTETRGIVEDYDEAKSVVDLAAHTLRSEASTGS